MSFNTFRVRGRQTYRREETKCSVAIEIGNYASRTARGCLNFTREYVATHPEYWNIKGTCRTAKFVACARTDAEMREPLLRCPREGGTQSGSQGGRKCRLGSRLRGNGEGWCWRGGSRRSGATSRRMTWRGSARGGRGRTPPGYRSRPPVARSGASRDDDRAPKRCRRSPRPRSAVAAARADENAVPIPTVAGEVLLIHNHVWHRSGRAASGHARRAMSVCYMDGATRCLRSTHRAFS